MIEINSWIGKKVKKVMNITFLITFTYFCFNTAAFAQDAVNVEIKPPTPTLDTLKGQPIPDTDPIRYYPESAYTLTKVDAKGDNTITVYEWDNTQNKLMPVYYEVSLKQTEYGEGDGVKYFKWEKTDDGIKLIETQNQSEAQITAKYDTSNLQTRINNTTDNSSTNIDGGSFVNQTTGSTSGTQYGGAIYNKGSDAKLGDINADFIGNYAESFSFANGGAIYNYSGRIGDITGDFIGNYVQGSSGAYGGAIYNYSGRIGDITGDFIGNYVQGSSGAYGGAINNSGTIGDITGDFIGNYVQGSSGAFGGAIHNSGSNATIESITGDFIGNYAQGSYANAGAIENFNGTIGDITGDFIGNYAQAGSDDFAYGGAIYNYNGTIENITGDFIGNSAKSDSSSTYGGAIYNYYSATIESITGDFIGNSAKSDSSSTYGGAIYNYGNSGTATIESITGDFIGNYADSSYRAYGGAIYNDDNNGTATIESITGNFIGNYAKSTGTGSYANAYGGAIYNNGTITLKDSSFINNGVISPQEAKGGAIYINSGTVNIIAENKDVVFDGNYSATAKNPDGTLENKKPDGIYMKDGNFNLSANDKNIIINDSLVSTGGTVNLLNGTLKFGKDSILNVENITLGSQDVNNVTLDVQNGATSQSTLNNITLNSDLNLKIDADLTAEKVDSFNVLNITSNGHSFNIENVNIIKDLGDYNFAITKFINNDQININIMDSVDAYLTSNYKYDISIIQESGNSYFLFKKDSVNLGLPMAIKEKGNVVYSQTEDEVINGWIISSDIQSDKFTLNGNNHTITSTNGTTEGLYIASGKELYIDNVKNISGFNSQNGGAIYAAGKLNVSNSTFSNNIAQSNGGAINISAAGTLEKDNLGVISGINITYGEESASAFATADTGSSNPVNGYNLIFMQKQEVPSEDAFNSFKEQINQIVASGDYVTSLSDLTTQAPNGLVNEILEQVSQVFQKATITYNGEVLGSYIVNGLSSSVFEVEFGLTTIGSVQSSDPVEYVISNTVFDSNRAQNGGAVSIVNAPINIEDLFDIPDMGETDISSEVSSKEEAMAMIEQMIQSGELLPSFDDLISDDYTVSSPDPLVTFVNTSFINNKADSKGGAIYANTDVTIKADNGTTLFKGNTANGESNAIYLDNADKTINLVAVNNGVIQFDDKIDGAAGYNVKISGDNEKSSVLLNNNVDNANVTSENIYLNLGKNNVFENSDFTITSGTLGFVNGVAEQQIMKSANINGNVNLALDVDLASEKMDTLPDNVSVAQDAKLNVNYLNLLSDANQDTTSILFANNMDYANAVQYTGDNPVAYSPIYKYDVSYAVNPEDKLGYFMFTRGSTGTHEDFNPAVVAPSVATQAGAYTTQVQTFNYAFQHADTFMNIPYLERVSIINQNKYALSPTADATDVGVFSPLMTKEPTAGFWVKPYASFENIPLKNGPKVSNINYGTLVGYDSALTTIKNGWERVLTGYIGYNGASQRFSGVDSYQNGGLIGGTTTLYKGNFFNATTLSVGATVGDSTNMYGSENYTMLLAGIGNKTGYNFEFKDGRYIIQPAMLLSYTFINTFDYNNAAGVRIESDPLHAIQLSPGIKFIMNTKNGWQPYLGVNMVWNLLDDSKVRANDVRLPEMSIKPYVQYGLGIQRRFNDSILAFGQAMISNGGRNGISLNFGLRFKLGKK